MWFSPTREDHTKEHDLRAHHGLWPPGEILLTYLPQTKLYYEAVHICYVMDEHELTRQNNWKGTLIDFKIVYPNGVEIYIEVGNSTAEKSKKKKRQLRVVQEAGVSDRYLQLSLSHYHYINKIMENCNGNGEEPCDIFWETVLELTNYDISLVTNGHEPT